MSKKKRLGATRNREAHGEQRVESSNDWFSESIFRAGRVIENLSEPIGDGYSSYDRDRLISATRDAYVPFPTG
ncbi:hypothetical protein [Rathayibacter sp. VKM Ac-2928]|uniref:hypothetical protein n=1 Tax=Rathayibacter sp. VKM Ac-2928 TaxID=2929479 RepID=UPI001FB29C9E|nr:hypothetical protein [Rathayibacter sp. VKM Ac-2928]MCJ1682339.1 hypothetical protein [Rathayibacter sp. VKM Ac-2928]